MAYRFNERENALRAQYEEAKATLEELAEERNASERPFSRLDNALISLGFKKGTIAKDKVHGDIAYGDIAVYIRENQNNLEILTDRDFAKDPLGKEREMHLYQIPAGQAVQGWYNSIPNFDEWKKKHYSKVGDIGLSAMTGCTLVGGVLGYLSMVSDGAFLGAIWIPSIIAGGLALLYGERKKHPLHKQTIAKGPAALRYIARNSICEAPRLRIETKLKIIDDEFTAENAAIDEETYPEQLREASAIEETEKPKRRK